MRPPKPQPSKLSSKIGRFNNKLFDSGVCLAVSLMRVRCLCQNIHSLHGPPAERTQVVHVPGVCDTLQADASVSTGLDHYLFRLTDTNGTQVGLCLASCSDRCSPVLFVRSGRLQI